MQGDLISRDELLKVIDTWDKFGCDADTKLVPYQDHYIPYIHYDDVVKCIKGMPSVNPQEKTGYWINITKQNLNDYRTGNRLCFECDQCHHQFTYSSNFCPNCGAIMVGDNNDR